MNSNALINSKAKLRWACRRGMLELDVLLGNFLEEQYDQLSLENKKLFVELLEESDPELFAWLMGQEVSKDLKYKQIIEMIRFHAWNRV